MTNPIIKPVAPADTQSANIIDGNLAQLKTLFPEAFKEGGVDFEVLKQLLGGQVDEREEKYGLNWHGKRRARQIALTPSTGTLRPCPGESVDWDTTQNLMIEGDNLEVLKLLQKSYAGKVKMIYIDPPYNTGKDFVYPDNFTDNIKNYLELTGQTDGEGRKLSSNTEASGRFHTDWLNMMYPRLKLARNLSREDGVIFMSIDDNELDNLTKISSDIFGEENFVGMFPWKRRTGANDSKSFYVSSDHEYLLAYARSSGFEFLGVEKNISNYTNPDSDPRGPWARDNLTCNKTAEERPNLFYPITDPKTGLIWQCNPNRVWAYEPTRMDKNIEEGKVLFPSSENGTPMYKRHLSELRSSKKPVSTWVLTANGEGDDSDALNMKFPLNSSATKQLRALMESQCFNFPKSHLMIQEVISHATESDEIVCDFFAGSGSTGHATLAQNSIDGAQRRFVLVQLPEPVSPDNPEQKTASDYCDKLGKPRNIAELTKERLRRAATKIGAACASNDSATAQLSLENEAKTPEKPLDLGFKVFKLDTSNIRAWNPNPDELADTLMAHTEHLAAGRTEADVLYEVLLKQGLDLAVPVQRQVIAGHTVHSVGAGALLVCLARDAAGQGDTSTSSVRTADVMAESSVTAANAEALALGIADWHTQLAAALGQTLAELQTRVVLRDSLFDGDVAKTNLTAILRQRGLEDVRSL